MASGLAALKEVCTKPDAPASVLLIMYELDESVPFKYAAPTIALAPERISLLTIKGRLPPSPPGIDFVAAAEGAMVGVSQFK